MTREVLKLEKFYHENGNLAKVVETYSFKEKLYQVTRFYSESGVYYLFFDKPLF